MRSTRRRYVRRMPKIYGNLQPRERHFPGAGIFKYSKRVLPYIIVIGLIYLVFAGSVFRVKNIEVKGATLTEPSAIQALVPTGGSLWSFPKATVAAEIMKNPAVENVRILRGLPNSILVEVAERSATAFWITGTRGAVLDDSGLVFLQYNLDELPAPDTVVGQTLAHLPHITDVSGLPADLDTQVASNLFLSFVGEVQKNMTELLAVYPVDHFEVNGTTYDVTMVTKPGLKVQLNSLGDAGVQIRNLARLNGDGKLTGAQSVDLRVDRWAYVK
jgi:hypothetical protein